jgi:hypothetical protein
MSFERYSNLVEFGLREAFGQDVELHSADKIVAWLEWLTGFNPGESIRNIIEVEQNSSITFYNNSGGVN